MAENVDFENRFNDLKSFLQHEKADRSHAEELIRQTIELATTDQERKRVATFINRGKIVAKYGHPFADSVQPA